MVTNNDNTLNKTKISIKKAYKLKSVGKLTYLLRKRVHIQKTLHLSQSSE